MLHRLLPRPIESIEHLPAPGVASAGDEATILDFKREQSPSVHAEMAKDIAAFANAFGGSILIGVVRENGKTVHRGIPGDVAQSLKESYEQVAKDWCRPTPSVRPVIIQLGADLFVVAVNIEAYVHGAVGAFIAPRGERLPHARIYPRREASHTKFLEPEELPMLFNPHDRIIAIRLLRLTKQERAAIRLMVAPPPPNLMHFPGSVRPGGPLTLCECMAELSDVDIDAGAAMFVVRDYEGQPCGDRPAAVPLSDVEDCWRGATGFWHVRVTGRMVVTDTTADAYEPVSR